MPETDPIPHSIALIGFMGCGKSTVGRQLHKLLGYPLVDTDHLIEQQAGTGIPGIFAERGEDGFREIETSVLRQLSADTGAHRIIATGGGIVIRRENRDLLRHLGCVVWLRADIETILARTKRNRDRPLLDTEDPRSRIESLLTERKPLYRETCHLEIETSGLSSHEIACGILESARYFFTGRS